MTEPGARNAPEIPHPAGLCGSCQHVQVIRSDRGAEFYLCRRSFSDPRFRRYPPIPVRSCPGYTPVEREI
jgi:hypothetical protein